MPKRGFTVYVPVWAFADTTERFIPISPPRSCEGVRYMRTGIDVYLHTGSFTIYPSVQVSDDAESWPGVTTFNRIGTHSATGDGITYSTGADVDVSSILQARYFREGVTVKNTGGTPKLEMALVAISFTKRPA